MIRRLLVRRTLKYSGTARGFENLILFTATVYLQRAQVVYEVPGVVGLDNICERRHGRAVQTGHENTIEVLIGYATLETSIVSCRGEVVRTDGLIFAVGEGRSRRAVTVTLLAMTLPALHLLEEIVATPDTSNINRRLSRDLDRLPRFFRLPALLEGLDVANQILPILVAQPPPRGHVAGFDAPHQRVDQVRVQRAGSGWS